MVLRMPQEHPARTRENADVRSRPAQGAVRTSLASTRPDSLRHVAIIPDGNRRWAAGHGLPLWDGVRKGVKTAEATFELIRQRGIHWCTFWASSYDNLTQRPKTERGVLNELFASWFSRLAENETVHREKVRVRAIGEWNDLLGSPARAAIELVLEATKYYGGPTLTFLVGYDGDRELIAAVHALLKRREGMQPDTHALVTMEDLRACAWTKDLPEVDLLVRTGSWEDPHRSANFLPLRTSNVQEVYPKLFWPDFSESELDAVIADFASRQRRLGT